MAVTVRSPSPPVTRTAPASQPNTTARRDAFDHVVGIFIQFVGPDQRGVMFDHMKSAVKPGGLLSLHGYTPKQLEYRTGGPGALENLYTEDQLAGMFEGWEIIENRAHEREVSEGKGHSGMSALIDFVARRP